MWTCLLNFAVFLVQFYISKYRCCTRPANKKNHRIDRKLSELDIYDRWHIQFLYIISQTFLHLKNKSSFKRPNNINPPVH